MAGAILSSIIQWMSSNKPAAPTKPSPSSSSLSPEQQSLQEDLMRLERTLLRIQAVISDAEEREIGDESVKLWLRDLKGVAYDAEDVLGEYGYEFLRAKAEGGSQLRPPTGKRKLEEVSDSITVTPVLTQVLVPDGTASKIKAIRMRFDEIAEARNTLQLREDDGKIRDDSTVQQLPTTPLVDESRIYGRDEDKKKLVEMLTTEGSRGGDKLSVIPIIGMGGIGKTTLVRLVYNDPTVCQCFSLRVWICVSVDFDVVKLCKTIIQSITKEPCDLTELSALQSVLNEELKGKRLLLVLDDVWNEKLSLWESFRVALIGGGRHKVIVTTRNESVSRIMQTVLPYRLSCLPEDQAWLLFQQYAFGGGYADMNPSLIDIGKKIVEKCNGLPLAVKTLGSLLHFESNVDRWEDILQSELWELDEEEVDGILPALKLSYHRMPAHLKPCFMYCSLFPKNYLFKKEQLVRLWMAQGLIQHKENRKVEDVGRRYFDDLLRRSFFQYSEVEKEELPQNRYAFSLTQTGKDDLLMKSAAIFLDLTEEGQPIFVMHDLICDLAQHIAGKECYVAEDDKLPDIPSETRHFSLIPNDTKKKAKLQSLYGCGTLRTLLFINKMVSTWNGGGMGTVNLLNLKIPKVMLQNLGCLRAMDLSYTRTEKLPDSIGELKHLCYLGLQGTKIKELPESLSRLHNLQTLDLKYCQSLQKLPQGVVKLICLRHLELPVKDFASCVSLPSGIGRLTSLQTLSAFNVGKDSGHCRISELKEMVNLKGHLGIAGLQNVASGKDAKEADLKGKEHLQTLALQWNARDQAKPGSSLNESNEVAVRPNATIEQFITDGIFEGLQPHTELIQLIVCGYYGTRFPTWLGDPSFSKLSAVTISKCRNCEFLPPLGQLPCLRDLLIGNMDGVQHIGPEFCGHRATPVKAFQALELLDFEGMSEWKKWDGVEDGDFPRLRRLVIKHCPKLEGLPCLPSSLEDLEMADVEGLTQLPALPSLKSYDLGGKWNENLWSSTSSSELHSLHSLEISWSENLRTLRLDPNLHALRVLDIRDCPKLTTVIGIAELATLERLVLYALPELQLSQDDQFPPTIQFLDITSCVSLTFLPLQQHLSALRELMIVNCPQLDSLVGLHNLASLEHLEISECPEISLQQDEVLPSTLQSFEVSGCDNLRSLPLLHQNLTALRELKIENCPQLILLEGIHNLASLEQLEIILCPELRLPPNEKLSSLDLDVNIMDCPGLVEWCQSQGIKHVQNDDWGDDEAFDEGSEDWDDDKALNKEDFTDEDR